MPGDLLVLLIGVAALAFMAPVQMVLRAKPRLAPGPELRLLPIENNQADYDRRIRGRMFTKIAFAVGAVYYGARAFSGPAPLLVPNFDIAFGILAASFFTGIVAAVVYSVVRDRRILAEHPSLASGMNLARRLLVLAIVGAPLLLLAASILTDGIPSLVFLALWFRLGARDAAAHDEASG